MGQAYLASCVAMSLSRLSLWSMLMRYCIVLQFW